MLTIAFTIVVLGLTGFALWSANRGEGSAVIGEGNNFESYYGKDRFNPNPDKTPPCENCRTTGCIGAGACSCRCHRVGKKKK